MEKVAFRSYVPAEHVPPKPWATTGKPPTRERNVVTSLHIEPEHMEEINLHLQRKYRMINEKEVRYEEFATDDAELLLVAYGLGARIAQKAVELARHEGMRVGLLRPITLWPFPSRPLRALADRLQAVLVVEMNAGQMLEDVRLSVEGKIPVAFYGRMGGIIPSPDEVLERLRSLAEQHLATNAEVH